MGGAQSLSIGLHNLDQFAYIAAFSASGNMAEWQKTDPKLWQTRGGHSWPNWQVYLSKYAPLLFRD
jgi:S-formylglutathione hydrolase FrmB